MAPPRANGIRPAGEKVTLRTRAQFSTQGYISRGPAHERSPVFEISLPISRPEVFCSQKRRWGFPVTYACTTSREK